MALIAEGLTKSFGGEVALAAVDLEVANGEIHALLGPNGSGKSTFIGCVGGRLAPDRGSITVGTTTVERFTPRSAFAAGAAIIYQHFSLIPTLSIADNIFLGSERTAAGRVDRAQQRAVASELLARLGAHLDPRTRVEALSVGEKQLVEIAKALRHEPELLILDEPTAALGELEARLLGQQVRKLRDEGLAILYVTHLLGEVFEIADRVTVLRDGRKVASARVGEISRDQLIAAISPEMSTSAPKRGSLAASDEPMLRLDSFRVPGAGPIDLSVCAGEVVGVFGLLGSGRSELLEGLYGIRGRTQGEVELEGRPLEPQSAAASLQRGLALVPAERGRQSIFRDLSALDNLLLPHFGAVGRSWWRSRRGERAAFAETAGLVRLKPPNPRAPAWTYSGGNQQKLVVGRWLAATSEARMLMLDEPTQGIDVGARADLYELLRAFARDHERAVLFTSSDPEEVQALADRVHVLVRGRIVAELRGEEIVPQRLLDLAHGASDPLEHGREPHVN